MAEKEESVSGYVRPGFEKVSEAFEENFRQRGELGASCCVFYRGEKVVNLWGGVRNKATGEPWEEDTMAVVFSTTKGLAGIAMALAHSHGLYDYEELVSKYWPEFAQNGKENITVRQLLSHQAGLYALDVPVERNLVADLDHLAEVLARQKPAWKPGTRQAYHAITLGFYESELLRRVDPANRSLGRFFQDEIASPLSLDTYIRLPEEMPNSRLAVLDFPSVNERITTVAESSRSFANAARNPHSRIRRALEGSMLPIEPDRIYARDLEIPSGGAVSSASGLAGAYNEFVTGKRKLELRKETIDKLMAPPIPPKKGFFDECLKVDIYFSLGFMKPSPGNRFGHPASFGAPGSGGSFGFADPVNEMAYGYVPNEIGAYLQDPRDISLRRAMYESIGIKDPYNEKG